MVKDDPSGISGVEAEEWVCFIYEEETQEMEESCPAITRAEVLGCWIYYQVDRVVNFLYETKSLLKRTGKF